MRKRQKENINKPKRNKNKTEDKNTAKINLFKIHLKIFIINLFLTVFLKEIHYYINTKKKKINQSQGKSKNFLKILHFVVDK